MTTAIQNIGFTGEMVKVDGKDCMIYETASGKKLVFDEMINQAEQSKAAFINFIQEIEISQYQPWLAGWLEEFWTDEMSKVFFDGFWNGSLEGESVSTGFNELPSFIDDLCKCIDVMKVVH